MLLLISLMLTIAVPVTGIIIHKLAALIFLILCVVHTLVERKYMNRNKYLLLMLVLVDFGSGILGMILKEMRWVLDFHRVISIVSVGVLSIHLFMYHKRMGVVCRKQ
ncbi:heme transporter CcmB [Dorea sp. YH-dor226]|uniref:heme transporter CcmB n=1 Tax=Dorea sp. YH-dor226 TaxID=3151119 RepID=UPI003242E739